MSFFLTCFPGADEYEKLSLISTYPKIVVSFVQLNYQQIDMLFCLPFYFSKHSSQTTIFVTRNKYIYYLTDDASLEELSDDDLLPVQTPTLILFKNRNAKFYCRRCLRGCYSAEILAKHKLHCYTIPVVIKLQFSALGKTDIHFS